MKKLAFAFLPLSLLFTLPASAAEKTATLEVPGMTCAACPVTVTTALKRVQGVQGVQVDFPKRLATVRYDDAKTNLAALEKATTDAGYPSKAAHQ
ncbi:MAG: mercury resistance system periplasmic binding protein MerP [Rhodanobacter sp.]|nr:MAG: mercury resistance system periplasmic binding protein MerP [Rhodanobacter sp.]TAM40957.1 MAG: mercury resistance system periplasmic binding protein MerP [Rhodanobacter sp.]